MAKSASLLKRESDTQEKQSDDFGKQLAANMIALVVGATAIAEIMKVLNKTEPKKNYSAYFYALLLLIIIAYIYFLLWRYGSL
jgi:hypothetical protein